MFKLIDYKIEKGQLHLNLKLINVKNQFDSEFANEFLSKNFNKFSKEITKIIKKHQINFNKGTVNLLINGTLLTSMMFVSGCSTSQESFNNIDNNQNTTIKDENLIINQEFKDNDYNNPFPGANVELKEMNLVLLAGHADRKTDPGAVYNNRYESEYAQELVLLIKSELAKKENINVNVILESKAIALVDEISFIKNIQSDYVISIHFNAGGGSGSEIIVPYDFTDLTIAEEVINNFRAFNQPIRQTAIYSKSNTDKTARKNGVKVASQKDYFGIIRTGTNKSIHSEIIEVEFIDNEVNMKFYDANKIKYAKSIANAIESYYTKNFNS